MARPVNKGKGVDPALEKAISKMLKEVMSDHESSIDAKMKVIDRALKLEALKLKITDDGFGAGFFEEEGKG